MRTKDKWSNGAAVKLAIIALLCMLLNSVNESDVPSLVVTAALICGVFLVVRFGLPYVRRRYLIAKVTVIVATHLQDLAKQRVRLVRRDAYGKERLGKWNKEVDYFISEHVRPALSERQQCLLQEVRHEIAQMIDNRVERTIEAAPPFRSFHDGMTPEEFEAFCAEELRSVGWTAETTAISGDQGVDVIARKNGVTVVLQCKLYYSGSVGNDAVQEIIAGRAFERADFAAVVTNNTYTASAEQLAVRTSVFLLHYTDLCQLDSLLPSRTASRATLSSQTSRVALLDKAADSASRRSIITTADANNDAPPIKERDQEVSDEQQPTQQSRFGFNAVVIALISVIILLGVFQELTRKSRMGLVGSGRRVRVVYPNYINEKFGYRISYPDSFKPTAMSSSSDGITLTSTDGAASLEVRGATNIDRKTTKDFYDEAIRTAPGKVGYSELGGSWFVVTWTDGNRVGYRKMFVGTGFYNFFTLTFPKRQQRVYDSVVTKIEKSFKPGELEDSH